MPRLACRYTACSRRRWSHQSSWATSLAWATQGASIQTNRAAVPAVSTRCRKAFAIELFTVPKTASPTRPPRLKQLASPPPPTHRCFRPRAIAPGSCHRFRQTYSMGLLALQKSATPGEVLQSEWWEIGRPHASEEVEVGTSLKLESQPAVLPRLLSPI